ncbi:MAG: hypothetical protein MI723_08555 [Caulobacterales bacterium]|nr:hypothetical protein [Caulobacterales bacterium]
MLGVLSALEIEAGYEGSSSSFHEGEPILGALTIEGRDFGDTHDGARRIALRGVRSSGDLVEVSIAVSMTQADSRGAIIVGSTGFDPLTLAPYEITGAFGDYEKLGIELGGRRYFVNPAAIQPVVSVRPFVGGSIGVARIEAIDAVFQSDGFSGLGLNLPDTIAAGFYDDSWVPTVSVSAGGQVSVSGRFAVEAEVGARWDGAADENDETLRLLGLERINDTAGRFSYPVMVRGRYQFQPGD